MWSPPGLNVESLLRRRSRVAAHRPPRPLVQLSQISGPVRSSFPVFARSWGFSAAYRAAVERMVVSSHYQKRTPPPSEHRQGGFLSLSGSVFESFVVYLGVAAHETVLHDGNAPRLGVASRSGVVEHLSVAENQRLSPYLSVVVHMGVSTDVGSASHPGVAVHSGTFIYPRHAGHLSVAAHLSVVERPNEATYFGAVAYLGIVEHPSNLQPNRPTWARTPDLTRRWDFLGRSPSKPQRKATAPSPNPR